jgi:hypothetical protein
MEYDLRVQVDLGDDSKHLVVGVGTITFHLLLANSLKFDGVSFVPSLRKKML